MTTDQRRATARTIIPALIGVLLAQLIAKLPAFAAVLGWADEVLADTAEAAGLPAAQFTAVAILNALLAAVVVWAWYRLARTLGDRWPSLEKWMLGSAERPQYPTAGSELVPAGMLDGPEPGAHLELDAEPIESEPVSEDSDRALAD